MGKMERLKLPIEDLRLWSSNPRYSLEPTIRIDKISESDFEIEGYDINKDNYNLNHRKNIKKLLSNKDSVSKTKDLIDSLKDGYDESKDQMFVVHPKFLDTYSSSNKNLKNIYYVIEGNRRLMCLDLILNYNNSREVLIEIIQDNIEKINAIPNDSKDKIKSSRREQLSNSNKDLEEILSIAIEAEKYFPETVIPCQVLDFDYYTTNKGIKQLNELLNAKHFGERKGKLNWPRGLILAKIFGKVKEFKRQNINQELTYSLVTNELNSYMGKIVTSGDINASMLLCKSVDIWNIRNPDNKLEYWNTEEGDVQHYVSDISYDSEGNEIKDATLSFSASALELAKNNIKIFDKNFKLVVLSKIISFKYNLDEILEDDYVKIANKEQNNAVLSLEDTTEILYSIINGVVEHKVTTRSVKDETESDVGREIRNILTPINDLSPEKILNSTFETFQYIPETVSDNENAINLIKNLNELVKTDEIFNKEALKDEDNIFLKTVYYIWKNEFGRIAKYKQKMTLKELPLMVISLLYRETYEFTLSLFYFYLTLDYWKTYDVQIKESKLFSRTGEYPEVNSIAATVSSLIFNSRILNLNNEPINESQFKQILNDESNNSANLGDIYSDFEQCFFIMIGDVNIPLDGEINFKYFKKIKLDGVINRMISENKRYNAANFSEKDSEFYKSESAKDLLDKYNYFSFSENDKKTKNKIVLRFLEDYDSDSKKHYINRLIHKPLFALSIYELDEQNSWYNKMNAFISFLIETSNILISLCTDKKL